MKHFAAAKLTSIMRLFFLSSVLLLALGCYPEGGQNVDDFDLVYTDYSADFNFDTNYTYSLPDKVIDLDSDEDDPTYIDEEYSDAILGTVKTNLNSLGWTEVSAQDADIVIVTGAFDENFIYFQPWWWDWYYPWYGPDWGWYYPGYYPGYISGYSTGSVLIQMTYPADTNSDNEIPVVWLGALNGLLQGGQASIVNRIDSNIDQAFNQPPFNN
ncbi:DUF4136 domain-containing protein [Pseudotamlana agarivorans]|uniref:DUF4136 domain-containing protein n=1 Tax=Pseudotamlana agarivorans TaxID=481183 RepID=UPI00082FDA7E|nr:DUF4136 domain-containing protein [Tamlana agarivorans]